MYPSEVAYDNQEMSQFKVLTKSNELSFHSWESLQNNSETIEEYYLSVLRLRADSSIT